jgi:hypothetical protein
MTTAHLYIAACIIVAGLDIYIGLKVWDLYFSNTTEEVAEDFEGEE